MSSLSDTGKLLAAMMICALVKQCKIEISTCRTKNNEQNILEYLASISNNSNENIPMWFFFASF